MKKKTTILTALALALCLTAGIGSAWAYFTTYAEARGGYTIDLGSRTEIEEDFYDWTKHVVITSDEGSEPVYVRARAYYVGPYDLEYSGEGWTAGDDGWYYYGPILEGSGRTEELLVSIVGVPDSETGNFKDGENFNVVVVYESTPVLYQEDGTPYADWNGVLDTGSTEGGGN